MQRIALALGYLLTACGGAAPAPQHAEPEDDAWSICAASEASEAPAPGGAPRLRIVHQHRMSPTFRWIGAAFAIDERCVARWDEDVLGAGPPELRVLDAPITRGGHRVHVSLRYRVRASGYGLFALSVGAYVFTIRSHHDVAHTRPETLRIVAEEAGGVMTPLEERPSVRYELTADDP